MTTAQVLVAAMAVMIACPLLWPRIKQAQRRRALLAKYGDTSTVDRIMSGKVWQGMTEEQLIDSWGRPVDIAETVRKSKVSATFKYSRKGRNRYADRVMLENGVVIGWQQN